MEHVNTAGLCNYLSDIGLLDKLDAVNAKLASFKMIIPSWRLKEKVQSGNNKSFAFKTDNLTLEKDKEEIRSRAARAKARERSYTSIGELPPSYLRAMQYEKDTKANFLHKEPEIKERLTEKFLSKNKNTFGIELMLGNAQVSTTAKLPIEDPSFADKIKVYFSLENKSADTNVLNEMIYLENLVDIPGVIFTVKPSDLNSLSSMLSSAIFDRATEFYCDPKVFENESSSEM